MYILVYALDFASWSKHNQNAKQMTKIFQAHNWSNIHYCLIRISIFYRHIIFYIVIYILGPFKFSSTNNWKMQPESKWSSHKYKYMLLASPYVVKLTTYTKRICSHVLAMSEMHNAEDGCIYILQTLLSLHISFCKISEQNSID